MIEPIKFFACPKCGREFSRYHGLLIHQNAARRHGGKCTVKK